MTRHWLVLCSIFFSILTLSAETDIIDETQTFIVRVQNDLKPSVFSDVEHWYSATLKSLSSNQLDSEKSQTSPTKEFIHIYKNVFHGFSTRLTLQEAKQLELRQGVLAVLPDRLRHLHTTRSPKFLGLTGSNVPNVILSESDYGSNVIIGIFDTGITPEHPSFHEEGLGPIPSTWKGDCTEGDKFTKKLCNKKIIGARYFMAGYEASNGGINSTIQLKSARDTNGHGTHTASTAAGRAVANASLFGYGKGEAAGIAPKARIAAYKICWEKGCMDSDILAGFDKAVEDGVDIISISVGGGNIPYHLDPIAIGAFGAMERGIFVSASAGNEGPARMSVTNGAPWITTVGASTIDRKFPADLVLEGGTTITGASVYIGEPLPENTFFPIIYAGNASSLRDGGRRTSSFSAATCIPGSLDREMVSGKIVVCDRGGNARVQKGEVVKDAAGVGVIVANLAPIGEGLISDAHIIPGMAITESARHKVLSYISSSSNPRATMVFRGTQVGVKPAPVVASFSGRGPSGDTLYVLKPDVIAPGVDIIAAWPNMPPTELPSDTRLTEFNILSGTSMSCPHVSGVAALLKGAHPEWSPAMIRSALMTTAYILDSDENQLLDEKDYNVSTIWDMGAGHVDPRKAVNPGLVYDLSVNDYLDFLCALNYTRQEIRQVARRRVACKKKQKPWNLNYPVISVVFDEPGSSDLEVVVKRVVTHVGEGAVTYNPAIVNPRGVKITLEPDELSFTEKGQKLNYNVRIVSEKVSVSAGNMITEFGELTWFGGKGNNVVSPIVIVWQQPF